MSARRDFLLTVAAGLLLAALGLVLGGWTVPQLLRFAASPAALIVAVWLMVVALAIVVIGRSAARADELADRALAERRDESADWRWPDRDVGVGRRS